MSAKSPSTAELSLKIKDTINPLYGNSAPEHASTWPFSAKKTDPEGWRLTVTESPQRLMWKYLRTQEERDAFPQDTPTRYFMGLPTYAPVFNMPKRPSEAVHNASSFHGRTQISTLGCWTADVSCILFVTPMLVISWYITGAVIPEAHAIEMVNYLMAIQNEDGGWPTYLQEETTMMGTTLMYVALRLMGLPTEHEQLVKARDCILRQGGAVYLPSWAKFWLSLLGLFEWEGSDPYPVELWLLPLWVPFNPWKFYCIPRSVLLPMTYLYSRKFTLAPNALLRQLREEIYAAPYSSINFASFRDVALAGDRPVRKSWLLRALNWGLVNVWNPWCRTEKIDGNAEKTAFELIERSVAATNSTGVISLDQFLFMIAYYINEGPGSKNVGRLQEASFEYLWLNGQGMQAMSIHGAHCWETSFALQTMVSTGLADKSGFRDTVWRAYNFLTKQQHVEDWNDSPPCFRFSRLGGWPFTTRYEGFACSDCTGEVLKAILLVESRTNLPKLMLSSNIRLAVDNLIMVQNPSGGYSSFEPILGRNFLELLNGTELFGKVMVEYDYTECTGSAITALALFRTIDKEYRAEDVNRTIGRGVQFIHRDQRKDGSWLADWGIGCTYAAMFALETLGAVGETYDNSSTVKQACDFLMSKQHADGGWGETIDSVKAGVYTQADDSHTVQTAWSCLALMHAAYPDQDPIKKGIHLIMGRQRATGEWDQERPVGCGIVTCTLHYHNYIFSFPIRAMNMYMQIYGDDEIL